MKKRISLIFFLTIILKPIFTKIAFPLCSLNKFSKIASTAECDSFGQHILSPFHHFESYFIIITILTYVMWYIGYLNFDNLDLKSAFDNKVFNKVIPKSININKSKINNIFSLRNIKILFSFNSDSMKKFPSLIFPAICLYISYYFYITIVEDWSIVDTNEPFLMPLAAILIAFPFGFISYFKKSWTFIGIVRKTMIFLAIVFFINIIIG
jgi:hypothetical protein